MSPDGISCAVDDGASARWPRKSRSRTWPA